MSASLLNDIIYKGGTGCLDPLHYDALMAGYGFSVFDILGEPNQPVRFPAGTAPSWCEIWLGVE
jgi:hypothetical protein